MLRFFTDSKNLWQKLTVFSVVFRNAPRLIWYYFNENLFCDHPFGMLTAPGNLVSTNRVGIRISFLALVVRLKSSSPELTLMCLYASTLYTGIEYVEICPILFEFRNLGIE